MSLGRGLVVYFLIFLATFVIYRTALSLLEHSGLFVLLPAQAPK